MILDTPKVREVLNGCGVDLKQLSVMVAICSEKHSHAVFLPAPAQLPHAPPRNLLLFIVDCGLVGCATLSRLS